MLAYDLAIVRADRLPLAMAFDRATARTFDADGRMHVKSCRISKANVCPYYGREIPNFEALGLDGARVYMMYRDPEELRKAAPTFRNLQLVLPDAHKTAITARDSKNALTVGTVGSEISFDGVYLVADSFTVWDKKGIHLVESEQANELSSAYRYRADMTAGICPAGVAYDGVMRDIKGNHVALVGVGRAGSDVLVSDSEISYEAHIMKRPFLLARLVALGVLPEALAEDPQRVALDSQLAAMTARDAGDPSCEDMEDDPENPGAKRKKKPAVATDAAALDAAIVAKGYITKADADKIALDAATAATAAAVKSVNDLHVAREAVKPLVGVVALDSAEAVYKFALEKEGVALDGVHVSAYPALVASRVALKGAAPVKEKTPVIAADAASAVAQAIPAFNRIRAA